MKLIGDIGGTNVRFALIDKNKKISYLEKFSKREFKNITEAINKYKEITGAKVSKAIIAVNTTVIKGKPIKNCNEWGYDSKTLKEDTGLKEILFVNDGVAHAMSIPYLRSEDKVQIYGGNADKKGPIVSISIGTEVGMSYGIYCEKEGRHNFYPSEGGEQIVSVAVQEHLQIVKELMKTTDFIRWGEIACGNGIALIYQKIFNKENVLASDVMNDLFNGSEDAKKTYDIFCEFLGILVRNTAYMFLPTGGIYLNGGVVTREENIELLKASGFTKYFEEKYFRCPQIVNVPIYICGERATSLLGLSKL